MPNEKDEEVQNAWLDYAQTMQEFMLAKKAGSRLSRERNVIEQRQHDNEESIKGLQKLLEEKRFLLEKACGVHSIESDLTLATLPFLQDIFKSNNSD